MGWTFLISLIISSKPSKSKKGLIETIIERYNKENIWKKAVQHLKEQGELEWQNRDIGKLIKEIDRDFIEEEVNEIKNILWERYKHDILKEIKRGFPVWYKEFLLKRSLN